MLINVAKDLDLVLKTQEQRLRHMDYQHVGLLSVVSLDDELDQRISPEELRVQGRVVDLMDKRVPIALSLDHHDLLLPNGLPKALPKIVDPTYPGRLVITEKIPMVEQKWSERASGETFAGGKSWIVLQPVRKLILLRDSRSGPQDAAWPRIVCSADYSGRHMLLLFSPESGRAHLVFGRFQFSTSLARPEAIPAYASA
jgi:hypothetical protein